MDAKLYLQNGEVIEVTPENGEHFTLQELQKMVGGLIQVIPLGLNLIVLNEEGKLIDGFEVNMLATEQWAKEYGYSDILFGNVLISTPTLIR